MTHVQTFKAGRKVARVYYVPSWDEYVIQYYVDGLHMDASDDTYRDRDAAICTAYLTIEEEIRAIQARKFLEIVGEN